MNFKQTTGGIYITILTANEFTPDKIEIQSNVTPVWTLDSELPVLSNSVGTTISISLDEISNIQDLKCVIFKGNSTIEKEINCIPGIWTTALIEEDVLFTDSLLLEDGYKLMLENNYLLMLE